MAAMKLMVLTFEKALTAGLLAAVAMVVIALAATACECDEQVAAPEELARDWGRKLELGDFAVGACVCQACGSCSCDFAYSTTEGGAMKVRVVEKLECTHAGCQRR